MTDPAGLVTSKQLAAMTPEQVASENAARVAFNKSMSGVDPVALLPTVKEQL